MTDSPASETWVEHAGREARDHVAEATRHLGRYDSRPTELDVELAKTRALLAIEAELRIIAGMMVVKG